MFYKFERRGPMSTFYIFDQDLKQIHDYEKFHKIYWDLIADEKLSFKPKIRSIISHDIIVVSNCFACAYGRECCKKEGLKTFNTCSKCPKCPIEQFRNYSGTPRCTEIGPYSEWSLYPNPDKAREIANLKFTEPQ